MEKKLLNQVQVGDYFRFPWDTEDTIRICKQVNLNTVQCPKETDNSVEELDQFYARDEKQVIMIRFAFIVCVSKMRPSFFLSTRDQAVACAQELAKECFTFLKVEVFRMQEGMEQLDNDQNLIYSINGKRQKAKA